VIVSPFGGESFDRRYPRSGTTRPTDREQVSKRFVDPANERAVIVGSARTVSLSRVISTGKKERFRQWCTDPQRLAKHRNAPGRFGLVPDPGRHVSLEPRGPRGVRFSGTVSSKLHAALLGRPARGSGMRASVPRRPRLSQAGFLGSSGGVRFARLVVDERSRRVGRFR